MMSQDGWTRAALGPMGGEGEAEADAEAEGGEDGEQAGASKQLTAEEVARRVEEMARLS